MKISSTTFTLAIVGIPTLFTLAACSGRPLHVESDDEIPTPRIGQATLVSLNQQVPATAFLREKTLRRHDRDVAELVARTQDLAEVLLGYTPSSGQLNGWAAEALTKPYVLTAAQPFASAPDVVVLYVPHTDSLSVAQAPPAALTANTPLHATARAQALSVLDDLATAGLADGDYVLGRSWSVQVSVREQLPFVREWAFEFFKVEDGFMLANSAVLIQIDYNYDVSYLKVRDVEVVESGKWIRAPRNSDAVLAQLKSTIDAELLQISPLLDADYAPYYVAYHLPAYEDQASMFPEVFVRWSSIASDGTTSQGRVNSLGFPVASGVSQVLPLEKPLLCRDFEVGRQVWWSGQDYVVDTDYLASFADTRDPFGRCERGRVRSTGTQYEFAGLTPGGLLGAIGLQNGDLDPSLCDVDTSSPAYGQCVALTGSDSLAQAFVTFAGTEEFRLDFERGGNGISHAIRLEDCPEVGRVVDCSQI